MPFRNCLLILALIVSYSIYGQNTVSIFILDSNNKVDSAWVANRYTQVGFTPLISISEINTSLNNSNFDVVIVSEGYSYVDTLNDYISDFLTENEQQIVQNSINKYKLLFNRKSITGTFTMMSEK
jgi:phosphoribosylformylglycinamidine (FGAM) synthase-like amidotransferase family enzyme